MGESLAQYGFGQGHPFGLDRYAAFAAEFEKRGLIHRVTIHEPVVAKDQTILTFHTPEYLEQVKRQSIAGQGYLDYGDTPAFVGVYEAAATVVGTTLAAVHAVMRQQTQRAFIPIAGLHHARRDMAGGFCVFNDCGVAIEVLRKEYGLRRIAYVDIDAHHGDGVFYSYEADPEVAIVDFHEDGRYLYPGTGTADETGTGAARGTKLNIPMPPLANDVTFLQHWDRAENFIRQVQPEIILLQCGADSILGDPLTHLAYTPATHGYATRRLCQIADQFCQGRVVAMGGGGYNRVNLANTWCEVVTALL